MKRKADIQKNLILHGKRRNRRVPPSSRSSKGGTATKGYTASKNKQSQSLSTGTSERDDYKQQAKRKAISASKKTAVSQFTGGTGIVSETKRPKNKLATDSKRI